jgi:hypothetical protein
MPNQVAIDLPGLPDISTAEQLAEVLQTTVASLAQDRYLHKGVPYCRVGSRIRYVKADVISFLSANRVQAVETDGQLPLFAEPPRQARKLAPLGGKAGARD